MVAFHFLLNRDSTLTIAQNDDDARLFVDQVSIDPRRITIIRGSGVDLEQFKPLVIPRTPDVPVAVCVSRMLWDKGIDELVAAARLLKSRGVVLKIRLVGPDDDNPAAISQDQLDVWAAEGMWILPGHPTTFPAFTPTLISQCCLPNGKGCRNHCRKPPQACLWSRQTCQAAARFVAMRTPACWFL